MINFRFFFLYISNPPIPHFSKPFLPVEEGQTISQKPPHKEVGCLGHLTKVAQNRIIIISTIKKNKKAKSLMLLVKKCRLP